MAAADNFRHPPMQSEWIDRPHRFAALGDLVLESGERIIDYSQSYVTHGELNADRSNALLVCASLTGNHHRLDFLIGPGQALDTQQYFVVCADPIGNGLSTSPSNSMRQPGMRFPKFAIRDMVSAQYRLLTEELKLERVAAVVGASMGGMQALQWAVSHPGFMQATVAMTPMARTDPWAAAVVETARACLIADPAWNGKAFTADPQRGWRAYTGLMAMLLGRTPAGLAEFARDAAEAGRWFERLTEQNAKIGFDAHDYLYQSWAYQAHDIGSTPGFDGTEAALRAIRTRTLIAAPPLDLFNPSHAARWAAERIGGARFEEIPSAQGHQAATSTRAEDAAFLNRLIGAFLRAGKT